MTNENTGFCILVLSVSLLVVGIAYFALARRTGNFLNILTPFLLLSVPAYFLLEFVFLLTFKYSGSKFAYFFIYATYTSGVLAKTIGFLAAPTSRVAILLRMPRLRVPGMPYFFLGLAFALYVPVLIEYADLLASPREIYSLTRTGYGVQSFLSTFCIYIGFILLLFTERRGRFALAIYFVLAAAFLYMHGSKGQTFYLLLIWLYFSAFVKQRKFGIGRLFTLGLVSSSILVGLFYLTSSQDLRRDLLISIAGYSSEYTRNAMMVIDDNDLQFQHGRLALENAFYALIPRQIFPAKRKDFGSLWLANKYYPERFQDDRGAPAFGLGVLYADFGIFSIVYYCMGEFLSGTMLGILAAQLRRRPDPGYFFLFAIFMDVPLIPTGTGFPLILYYCIAHVVKALGNRLNTESASLERTAPRTVTYVGNVTY